MYPGASSGSLDAAEFRRPIWGWPSKLLHWLGAIAILSPAGHGWWMVHMAPRPERFANYAWHAALGYDLLALVVLRLLWRWMNPVPALARPISSAWERHCRQVGPHRPLRADVRRIADRLGARRHLPHAHHRLDLFGLPIPQIVPDRTLHDFFEESHTIPSYLLAALDRRAYRRSLRHHFVKHNDVMRRMWFGAAAPEPASDAVEPDRGSAKSTGS